MGAGYTVDVAMMGFERSDDYQPLFWVRGRPIHVTALLVILHTFGLIVYCLMLGFAGIDLWRDLNFSSDSVMHHGEVWQVVTYAFIHRPSLMFVLDMAFLFIWGREVERYFGRKTFIALYSALLATAPVVLIVRSWVTGENQGLQMEGSTFVHMGVFIVFTTIYPNVQFFFGIACKWIAAVLLAITTLQCIAYHLVDEGLVLWANVAVAFLGARYASMGSEAFDLLGNFRERFPRKTVPLGVKPRLKPRRAIDTAGGGYAGGGGGGRQGTRRRARVHRPAARQDQQIRPRESDEWRARYAGTRPGIAPAQGTGRVAGQSATSGRAMGNLGALAPLKSGGCAAI